MKIRVRSLFSLALVTCALSLTFQAKAEDYPGAPAHDPGKGRIYDSNPADDRPNALSIELLGRGLLYSFNYDRSLSEHFALGVGIAAYSASSNGSSASAVIIPVYGNYYFSPGPHRGFVTAGVDIVSVSANLSGNTIGAGGAAPIIGGGYEYRGEGGFLFRFPAYILIGNGQSTVTIGLGFGFTFN
jgi:hypothetical protein